MAAVCGDCPLLVVPTKKTLKDAGMAECNIGFCIYAGDFVLLSDNPEEWGCRKDEQWQR